MPSHQELQLQGDIRQALENYVGDYLHGKWADRVVETLADILVKGYVDLDDMVQFDLSLRKLFDAAPVSECACGEPKYG